MSRNERRVHKYNLLRASGFTRSEATKYKDRGLDIVEALCDVKKSKDKELQDRLTDILERS